LLFANIDVRLLPYKFPTFSGHEMITLLRSRHCLVNPFYTTSVSSVEVLESINLYSNPDSDPFLAGLGCGLKVSATLMPS